jgi:hypothetical protein
MGEPKINIEINECMGVEETKMISSFGGRI